MIEQLMSSPLFILGLLLLLVIIVGLILYMVNWGKEHFTTFKENIHREVRHIDHEKY